jgi:hypothetical protein
MEWIGDIKGDGIPLLAHNVDRALYEERQWSGGIVQESDVSRAGVRSSSGPLAVIFDGLLKVEEDTWIVVFGVREAWRHDTPFVPRYQQQQLQTTHKTWDVPA